ncbi:hypothetical protein SAY86_028668 [Trapa natans]|uniref:Transmembrane protein n=1 Tax=Trapa natans TaxID=22666 RepID=A0AAN7MDA3_TRANT|nr:hypothetical protein SAY86_028668 [Trapa natans]
MAIFIILTKRSFRFSFLPCICIPFSKCFFCSITTTGRGNLRPPMAIIARKLLLFPSSITLLLLFTFSAICSRSADNSLDSSLQESAFKILTQHQHPHTGSLYRAWLPAEYAGMEVSVVRLRTKTLWRKGTNFSSFSIPPRTVPIPHVKRLVIVYQDMGNWSSLFFSVPGYTLVTHVVGFTVYDASNVSAETVTRIELDPAGAPISIQFQYLSTSHLSKEMPGQRCVSFLGNGSISFSEVRLPNVCYVESQGRFSIAVPVERRHVLAAYWAVGIGIWFMGMVVVFYVGAVQYRRSRTEKVRAMERDAEEGELFGTVWVGGSKMPSAAVTRTQPVLESGNFP